MPCTTPSNPDAIEFGESLDATECLDRTSGTLFADGRPMRAEEELVARNEGLRMLSALVEREGVDAHAAPHRVSDLTYLCAQAEKTKAGVQQLWKAATSQPPKKRAIGATRKPPQRTRHPAQDGYVPDDVEDDLFTDYATATRRAVL